MKEEDKLKDYIKKGLVRHDLYWLYFGYGEGWGDKCERCFKELKTNKQPYKESINCWKFEIWIDNLTDVEATLNYLLEEAEKDHTLHGKLLKRPMPIYEAQGERLGSCKSHSIPEEAKPDSYLSRELTSERLILIYNQTIQERDARMTKIIGELKAKGLYKKETAPYRRGCIQPHEDIIGPWEKWYDLDKDYV